MPEPRITIADLPLRAHVLQDDELAKVFGGCSNGVFRNGNGVCITNKDCCPGETCQFYWQQGPGIPSGLQLGCRI